MTGIFESYDIRGLYPDEINEETMRRIGFAFDGDADRCGFIDEQGQRVRSDLVIAILAEYFLRRKPGATILYDLRASRVVSERIRELSGVPVKTRVGHSFIKEKMREVNAVFASELSGHYYYQEMGVIDNGILSMITMLNILTMKREPLTTKSSDHGIRMTRFLHNACLRR